ncbi:glycosyltransferase family 2 protein [Cyanobacterium stanieri LEGE 03274]|uniref:Glycosyltransferase family 2 protein n=1 Tax=Cyanobacterium stanieri LEGE 03274 TaxID=1828756 RepID=A0ABR9V2N3_9CHRO|nr:glycosyltransferase family 2 protein [Cyanobacterium stanieri]MBE9222140.1 glycosyltransferase family 2 protein [Cyanobacterium stanieri LEGE 03274]
MEIATVTFFVLLLFQTVCTFILLARLFRGAKRFPPLKPQWATPDMLTQVSVVVPTLNEVNRMDGMLSGITRQTYEVREILIVDSNSEDGTREKVKDVAQRDPRVKLLSDPPLPANWVGRPWALHNGFLTSSQDSEWILGIDADTQPQPGLIPSLINFAQTHGYDVLSLSPQFILKSGGEWWLQPALLMTLLYRFESSGVNAMTPETVMANGQCFLIRRKVLEDLDGYAVASNSFCDDVTLARGAAMAGYKVGFADGAKLIKVRMYEGLKETWQEWGRSLDLKDAASKAQLWAECGFLALVQGLPLPLTIFCLINYSSYDYLSFQLLFVLNLFLLLVRFALLGAIAPSYEKGKSFASLLFWLSPTADILAVTRIFISALSKPKKWRGRVYNTQGN